MREKLLLKLSGETQLFRGRLRLTKDAGHQEIWISAFENLVALGTILIENKEKLTDEEIEDYLKLYNMGAIAHNPFNKPVERQEAVEMITKLMDGNIDRYAFALGMNKQDLSTKIEEEKRKIYSVNVSSKGKESTATVVGKELNLPPLEIAAKSTTSIKVAPKVVEFPSLPIPETTSLAIKPAISEERIQLRALSRRRIDEESQIKFFIEAALVEAYENLKIFERYFDIIKNVANISDITRTREPNLRNTKIRTMKEHLDKLEAYYSKTTKLYNDYYGLISAIATGQETATFEEFVSLKTLVNQVRKISEALKIAAGAPVSTNLRTARDITVSEYQQRRLKIRDAINEYNAQLAKFIETDEYKPNDGFKLS